MTLIFLLTFLRRQAGPKFLPHAHNKGFSWDKTVKQRLGHPPVLRAVDAQCVRVRVLALHRQVTGGVARLLAHHAEAVDAGDLCRGLTATQPRKEPAHLVGQVI